MRAEGKTWAAIAQTLRERFGLSALAALRHAHGWSQSQATKEWTSRWPTLPKTYKDISDWETGRHTPSLDIYGRLAELYSCDLADLLADRKGYRSEDEAAGRDGDNDQPAIATPPASLVGVSDDWTTVTPPAIDDPEAIELVRRVEASDTGPATLEGLTSATDRMARSYTSSLPADLLVPLRLYRGYITNLLGGHATLAQRRELIVLAGWLSLLTAICDIDLRHDGAAAVNLKAAHAMAHEADHSLLTAWALETEAWQALTASRPDQTVSLSQAARDLTTVGTSAHVQITIQAARGSARLGLARATHQLLEESATSLNLMPPPEHPEHHFTFDRRKHISYTATTLAWLGDDPATAGEYARQAVAQYDTGATDGRWRSRLASARLDLALILARQEPGEAAELGVLALDSGYLRPSNMWRAVELDGTLGGHSAELDDFHERVRAEAPSASG